MKAPQPITDDTIKLIRISGERDELLSALKQVAVRIKRHQGNRFGWLEDVEAAIAKAEARLSTQDGKGNSDTGKQKK